VRSNLKRSKRGHIHFYGGRTLNEAAYIDDECVLIRDTLKTSASAAEFPAASLNNLFEIPAGRTWPYRNVFGDSLARAETVSP